MTHPSPPPGEAQKADERALWEQTASGYDEIMGVRTGLFTDALVEAVGAVEGDRALDVACGPGQVARGLTRSVGPTGLVVGLDQARAMVEIATRHAATQGTRRCLFLQGDAEALPFAQGAFDVASCQFGLMLFPRPAVAVAELHRVLRPGGRAGFAVWATPDRATLFQVTGEALKRAVPDLPATPGPGPCSLGAPGALEAVLVDGGFRAPEVRRERRTWVFPSLDAFWSDTSRASRTVRQLLGERDAAVKERIEAAFRQAASPFLRPDGSVALEMEALFAVVQA